MADKKLEKALYGPSTFEVALGAVLGFLVGLIGACVFLVFKPVIIVKETPKEPAVGVIYFLPGGADTTKTKALPTKQKRFVAGTSGAIVLDENELNAWAASLGGAPSTPGPAGKPPAAAPKPPTPKPGAKPGEPPPAAAPAGLVTLATPNFRIRDGKMQIGVKCTLNIAGMATDVLVLATGGFEKASENFVFHPETFYLGSCPVHRLPGALAPVLRRVLEAAVVPEEIRAGWAKLAEVSLEGTTLKLAMQ